MQRQQATHPAGKCEGSSPAGVRGVPVRGYIGHIFSGYQPQPNGWPPLRGGAPFSGLDTWLLGAFLLTEGPSRLWQVGPTRYTVCVAGPLSPIHLPPGY